MAARRPLGDKALQALEIAGIIRGQLEGSGESRIEIVIQDFRVMHYNVTRRYQMGEYLCRSGLPEAA
jgi:hypothetical protein